MNPIQKNDDLVRLLRGHLKVEPTTSADFRSAVWQRIESRRAGQNRWAGWLRLHRAPIASATLASLVISVSAGSWVARLQERQIRDRLVEQYVTSIDHGVRMTFEESP